MAHIDMSAPAGRSITSVFSASIIVVSVNAETVLCISAFKQCFIYHVANFLILYFMFFSVVASLEVEITPSQGEISLGESKFFMCEGKFTKLSWLWTTPIYTFQNCFDLHFYVLVKIWPSFTEKRKNVNRDSDVCFVFMRS